MNKIFTVIFLLYCFAGCGQKTSLDLAHLKGPVKNVTIYEYSDKKAGSIVPFFYPKFSSYFYNQEGFLEAKIQYPSSETTFYGSFDLMFLVERKEGLRHYNIYECLNNGVIELKGSYSEQFNPIILKSKRIIEGVIGNEMIIRINDLASNSEIHKNEFKVYKEDTTQIKWEVQYCDTVILNNNMISEILKEDGNNISYVYNEADNYNNFKNISRISNNDTLKEYRSILYYNSLFSLEKEILGKWQIIGCNHFSCNQFKSDQISFLENNNLEIQEWKSIEKGKEYKLQKWFLSDNSLRIVADIHPFFKQKAFDVFYMKHYMFLFDPSSERGIMLKRAGLDKILEDEEILNQITDFDFSEQGLTQCPNYMKNAKNAKKINFNKNGLLDLPDLKELINLEILNLSNNSFETLPFSLLNLPNLKELIIINCPIQEIPKNMNLPKLEILIADFCLIKNVSASLFSLSAIKSIQLSGNRLTIPPKNIKVSKSLKSLHLKGNPINEEQKELWRKSFPDVRLYF